MAFMAKTRPGRKDLDSYTIRGTTKVVRGSTTNDDEGRQGIGDLHGSSTFPFPFSFDHHQPCQIYQDLEQRFHGDLRQSNGSIPPNSSKLSAAFFARVLIPWPSFASDSERQNLVE